MELHSDESIRTLEYAAEREKETMNFYRSCIDRVDSPGTKEILRGLVDDERKHHDIFMRMLKKGTRGEIPPVETMHSEAAKVRLERAFTHHSIEDPKFVPERQDIRGILEKALEIEKESFSNYSKASEGCTNLQLQSVYAFLAAEENKHYIILENLLSYLDVPGRWLYYEENLIFQNG